MSDCDSSQLRVQGRSSLLKTALPSVRGAGATSIEARQRDLRSDPQEQQGPMRVRMGPFCLAQCEGTAVVIPTAMHGVRRSLKQYWKVLVDQKTEQPTTCDKHGRSLIEGPARIRAGTVREG